MEQIVSYIKPELLILTVVLYFLGIWIKKSEKINDRYIPLFLGGLGIFLSAIWVLGTSMLSSIQDIAYAIFTAIVQGILLAGASTYVNQIFKQLKKE